MRMLKVSRLSFEELEAIRLADVEGLSQLDGAEQMGVSRATFGRVLAEARSAVAHALTNGWSIRIEGGHYSLAEEEQECPRHKGRRAQ